MKRVIAFTALSLAICGLLLIPMASAAKGERPFKIKGVGVLSLDDFSGQDEGQLGPGGAYTNQWQILPDGSISGTITVANGDELEWSGMIIIVPVGTPPPVMTTYTIDGMFTGGTGRFADADGHFQIVGTGTQIGEMPSLGITVAGSGWISY